MDSLLRKLEVTGCYFIDFGVSVFDFRSLVHSSIVTVDWKNP